MTHRARRLLRGAPFDGPGWSRQFLPPALFFLGTRGFKGHRFSVSSLPILEKGEQFLRVIGILTLLCSHYKIGLLRKLSLIKFYKYAIIVATMYIDTSHITRRGKTYTRHLLRESYRAHGKGSCTWRLRIFFRDLSQAACVV